MIGRYRHRVVFQQRVAVPQSDGGYTETWTDLAPGTWKVSLDPASPNDLERATGGTVITQLTYLVKGRYHPGVTTATRMRLATRTFAIAGTRNVAERGRTMELLAVELAP